MIKMHVSDKFVVCVLRRQHNVTAAVNTLLTVKAANPAVTNRRRGLLALSQHPSIDTHGYGPRRRATDADLPTPQSGYLLCEPTLAVILITADEIGPAALRTAGPDLFELPGDEAARDTLIAAIRTAMTQDSGRAEAAMRAARAYCLTVREREVLEQMIAGQTSKEIARILRISPRTVQAHRGRVLAKLSARNSTEAVRIALASGANDYTFLRQTSA